MAADAPTIFLTAAEASGDTHAANLIRALRAREPGLRFAGIGGPRMAEAGCELLEDVTAHASMLLGSVRKLGYFRGIVRRVAEAFRATRPAVHVPVDSPALNWHLAAAAKGMGIPVMYYIAPQVWAWAPWRVKKLRRLTDRVACLLPFEEPYLRQRGIDATFVGHPLFDHVPPRPSERPAAPADEAWRIALLPGSRTAEVATHAPALRDAAEAIRRRYPRAEVTFAAAHERAERQIVQAAGREIPILTGRTHEVMAASHFALAVSGTVTLEAAYFGLPMVVFYRASRVGYAVGRGWLFRTEYLSLVNIVAGRPLVPELMPWSGRSEEVALAALRELADPDALAAKSRTLIALAESLRAPAGGSASDAAAQIVLQTLRA